MTEPDEGFDWVETVSNDEGDDYPDTEAVDMISQAFHDSAQDAIHGKEV